MKPTESHSARDLILTLDQENLSLRRTGREELSVSLHPKQERAIRGFFQFLRPPGMKVLPTMRTSDVNVKLQGSHLQIRKLENVIDLDLRDCASHPPNISQIFQELTLPPRYERGSREELYEEYMVQRAQDARPSKISQYFQVRKLLANLIEDGCKFLEKSHQATSSEIQEIRKFATIKRVSRALDSLQKGFNAFAAFQIACTSDENRFYNWNLSAVYTTDSNREVLFGDSRAGLMIANHYSLDFLGPEMAATLAVEAMSRTYFESLLGVCRSDGLELLGPGDAGLEVIFEAALADKSLLVQLEILRLAPNQSPTTLIEYISALDKLDSTKTGEALEQGITLWKEISDFSSWLSEVKALFPHASRREQHLMAIRAASREKMEKTIADLSYSIREETEIMEQAEKVSYDQLLKEAFEENTVHDPKTQRRIAERMCEEEGGLDKAMKFAVRNKARRKKLLRELEEKEVDGIIMRRQRIMLRESDMLIRILKIFSGTRPFS